MTQTVAPKLILMPSLYLEVLITELKPFLLERPFVSQILISKI